MSNLRCPKCGEEYSDTYRTCPFCEEEAAIRQGKPLRRRGGRRLEKRRRAGGAGGVMLLVTGVVILGVVGFVCFGDQVAGLLGIRTGVGDSERTQGDTSTPAGQGGDTQSGQATQDGAVEPDGPVEPDGLAEPAGPLALSQSNITIAAGDTARLTSDGGAGPVTWSTSNENIATVADGAVTGVAGGTVIITAAAGEETVSCTVVVTGDPWVSTASLSLNRTDFTLRSSDPPFQLVVSGTDSAVTWTSADPSVAAVSDTGLVSRGSQRGMTTVTASVDGQTLACIVRVS